MTRLPVSNAQALGP